jgi:hypothetical protein
VSADHWSKAHQVAGYVKEARAVLQAARDHVAERHQLRPLQRGAKFDEAQGAIKLKGEQASLLLMELDGELLRTVVTPTDESAVRACAEFARASVVELRRLYAEGGELMRAELSQFMPEGWTV